VWNYLVENPGKTKEDAFEFLKYDIVYCECFLCEWTKYIDGGTCNSCPAQLSRVLCLNGLHATWFIEPDLTQKSEYAKQIRDLPLFDTALEVE
jgi:hypothetical protein